MAWFQFQARPSVDPRGSFGRHSIELITERFHVSQALSPAGIYVIV